jgi:hypothetical protein
MHTYNTYRPPVRAVLARVENALQDLVGLAHERVQVGRAMARFLFLDLVADPALLFLRVQGVAGDIRECGARLAKRTGLWQRVVRSGDEHAHVDFPAPPV